MVMCENPEPRVTSKVEKKLGKELQYDPQRLRRDYKYT